MSNRKYYVICEDNCKFEGMTKEQILTAIQQAVEEGQIHDVDAGFVTTIRSIDGRSWRLFTGTQAEYNDLTDEEKLGLLAFPEDDAVAEEIISTIRGLLDGSVAAEEANHAYQAESAADADHATEADFAANADHANEADIATSALNANHASSADYAGYAAEISAPKQSGDSVNATGLYLCNVKNTGDQTIFSLPLVIADLNAPYKAVGAFYDGTYNNGVQYNPAKKRIETTNAEHLEIVGIYFIAASLTENEV